MPPRLALAPRPYGRKRTTVIKRAPVRADDGSHARQNLSLLRVEFRLRDQALVQQGLELGELLFCGGAVLHIATNVVVQSVPLWLLSTI